MGLVTNLCRLERRNIFEGVSWHYAIVRVGSGEGSRDMPCQIQCCDKANSSRVYENPLPVLEIQTHLPMFSRL